MEHIVDVDFYHIVFWTVVYLAFIISTIYKVIYYLLMHIRRESFGCFEDLKHQHYKHICFYP